MLERTMGTSTPANAPRDVKTTEKPAMNRRIGRVFGRRADGGTDPRPSPAAVTKDR
jgi:hypothetical protein